MSPGNNTIMVPAARGLSVVDIASIVRVEAAGSYSKLFLSGGKTMVLSKVLKQMEEILAEKGFARVHRSHLVNMAFVQSCNLFRLKIILYNKEEITISRRKSRNAWIKAPEEQASLYEQKQGRAA